MIQKIKLSFQKVKNLSLKQKIVVALVTSLSLGAIGLGVFYFTNNHNTQLATKDSNQKTEQSSISFNVFSQMDEKDFYQSVYIEDGKAKIDKDIVAKIVKDQITRLGVSHGDLKVGYFVENEVIFLDLIWTSNNNQRVQKSFKLYLS
ncbi:unknown; predicted coding region [Mycoplasmopsis pulmonis]|uniref:Uncharacterized protein n=1 Tax=Mycoplasmopsis pulmonis (strain UAB CTIP) TaxID=272635 RepID=Q98QK4_MYCPU|nr:hypothetical protein [Mycoplasmopsis pulmonis]MDZ7293314.1 hypothetical protein [Mycoplasmopsis pulmonis]CAC13530.1 unknown; predicted coding region [Mycoplasmopsis pulmonis]VEU68119.1 Uncharacterised protein [Mycoplasmopsis pulmonis]